MPRLVAPVALVAVSFLGAGMFIATGGTLTVKHSPPQPRSGEPVQITVRGAGLARQPGWRVEYQVVPPGQYIERNDRAYQRGWVPVPLVGTTNATNAGDATTDTLQAALPASLQKHRHLIRYRIASKDGVVAPAADDAEPNFSFFVYDGPPAWRAAINPARDTPIEFSAEVMGGVQVYQFIATQSAVENTTWYEPSQVFDESSRHGYGHTCTIVADGQVYDHVRFRVRGGEWRHAMGKNMWKFDFNRGHHLRARDDYGRPYRTKWEKLNLGACIQQGSYGRRGEHGLYEAVTYRLFNLAGVPAPRTHYVHLRIVDSAVESPTNQYESDFWGLYLATEEIDGDFLIEHGLPEGNVYKWDFGRPKPEHLRPGAATNGEDILQFTAGYTRRQPAEEWWRENVDLPRYYSYRSIIECVRHYDIAFGKNYFYYLNPHTKLWSVFPWDVDLTWKNGMYGTGQEPFHRAGLLRWPQLNVEYQNRLRDIRDLLFNPEETGALIDELAAVIARPASGPSFVDADRARWDYHPIMASRWVHPVKAGQGRYYMESPTRDFRGMVQVMKEYVIERGQWCDSQLLTNAPVPPTPVVVATGPLKGRSLRFAVREPVAGAASGDVEWRLAEITNTSPPKAPRKYEIEAAWEDTGKAQVEIPGNLVESGRRYRVRARLRDANGLAGHWSAPVEFVGDGQR